MNLSGIDLNLLVVFEALYETRNVTVAGRRLHRAQPSVSNALGRLRVVFQDELFVRTATAMVPTEHADSLMPTIRQALDYIRATLSQKIPFDPALADGKRFVIAASDYADMVIVPHIVALFRREAPNAHLRVCALNRHAIFEELDDGQVDIAIGGHLTPPKRMGVTSLYKEDFVCIADQRHPTLQRQSLDIDTFIQLPHALFVPSDDGSTRGVIDAALDQLGKRRHVAATFAHLIALPNAIRGTDLIGTIARRAAQNISSHGLGHHPYPRELDDMSFSIYMVFSPRSQDNQALRWLRQTVISAVDRMPNT